MPAKRRYSKRHRWEPPSFLGSLALLALSFILSAVFRPKPQVQHAKPAVEGDFDFPTATEGRVVPLVWGTVQIRAPNLVWYGDYVAIPYSHKGVIHTYSYWFGMQFALCRGPVDRLHRVWVGEKEAWNGSAEHHDPVTIVKPNLFGEDRLGGNTGVQGGLYFHEGSDDQTIASQSRDYLRAQQGGTSGTPDYRGICYLVSHPDRVFVGTSPQIHPWWFEVEREIPASPTASASHVIVNGHDANPAFVIYEILTDTEWGLGIPAADIDNASFKDAAELCYDEGNGFSMVLDTPREASELLRLLEEQIDGMVFPSHVDGKWKLKMIRPDADLPTTPPTPKTIDASNLVSLESFARGTWDGVTTEVHIEFQSRGDEYKDTFAGAQDPSSYEIQGGVSTRDTLRFPGVKDSTLARNLAARELRSLSYPMSKATVVVSRDFHDTEIGDRIQLTDADLGLTLFGMRVARVSRGSLDDGMIRLELVEDIYRHENGVFTPPPDTGWGHPGGSFTAVDKHVVMEAPRALCRLRQEHNGSTPSDVRLLVAARGQDGASAVDVMTRHGTSDPSSGDYTLDGMLASFSYVGKLKAALPATTIAVPHAGNVDVEADPDTLAALESVLEGPELTGTNPPTTLGDMGRRLTNLVLIGDEFMFVGKWTTNAGDLRIQQLWRGALDTIQQAHSADADVFFFRTLTERAAQPELAPPGLGLMDRVYPETDHVDVKLLPRNSVAALPEGSASEIELQMDKRARRPYCFTRYVLAGTAYNRPTSISLEDTGILIDQRMFIFSVRRRDYDLPSGDELAQLAADADTLQYQFTEKNDHTVVLEVWKDHSSTPVKLFTMTLSGYSQHTFLVYRNLVLRHNAGAVPSELRLVGYTRHVDDGETLASRYAYTIDMDCTSAYSSLHNGGALANGGISTAYTVASSVAHTFTIDTALANALQYRINGGAWQTAIAAGATTGTTPALTASDSLQFRHQETVAGLLQGVEVDDGTNVVAYGVLYT